MRDGILNIYKEKGYTSHDVVAKMRGILKMRKIGHTGTLDPDAEGVLPVCLGHATKLCDMLTDKTKEYEAVMLLGRETDTQDTSGKTLSETEVTVTEAAVQDAVMSFLGEYDQIPPMYSALKVGGKKLYELAREGKEIEREARRVEILKIEILEIDLPRVRMLVGCSKGTYIRTLCYDIGRKLGCGGCMEKLLRTRVDRFTVEDSLTLKQVEELRDAGKIDDAVYAVDEVFAALTKVKVIPEFDRLVHNGNQLRLDQVVSESEELQPQKGEQFRVYDSTDSFIGVYWYKEDKEWLQPFKLFIGG